MLPHLHAKCVRLHADLSRHSLAWPFLEPVDPIVLNIPTYFDVITRPMDLATMNTKLTNGEYNDPVEYRADLLLMFANAIEFNRDDEQAVTSDWALKAETQAQERFIQRAKESHMLNRWKRDSFVTRLNRDKLDERRRLAESTGE
ncbi:unnamed protein product [Peronospora belbahrii]|uniref:Bromo domain-containing protein n=1 Tax=Peronospora belbahrii TaxID=622444 RepID=A0ABN8D2C8_9STRA|nr:unnamed protein product [Peronospora belbahrii]